MTGPVNLPVIAAGTALPFPAELVLLLALSVGIAYLCYRVGLVPIAGFLLAGVVVGPGALGLVEDRALIDVLAEIGVILLLFTIGIEFKLEKLAQIGREVFVGGGLQVGLTVAIVSLGLLVFGVPVSIGIYTGFLVALSSTAIVLGLLADRAESDTPTGQLSLAVLIFQDLAIIAMVLLVPMLGGEGGSGLDVALALGKAVLLIAAVLLLARSVVPWILRKVAYARRTELFLLTVVAICFGTAWVTSLAGVSLALGAFLAGLVVSESAYSEYALSEVLPLRTLFNAVFFVSVGMLLDIRFVVDNAMLVLGAVAVVLIAKGLITGASVLLMGYPVRIAAAVSLSLVQIGEFSFVLDRAGRTVGLSPMGLGTTGEQAFIAVTVLLMIATPGLMKAGRPLGEWLERTPVGRLGRRKMPAADGPRKIEDHVIVIGYGLAGRRLSRLLREVQIPFEVIDLNPRSLEVAEADGVDMLVGDASRLPILQHAAVDRAKLLVVAINDPSAALRIVQQAHLANPTLQIIVRTRFIRDVEALHELGADVVVPEELETAVRIFAQVLGAYMVPRDEIEEKIRTLRADDYGIFRGSIQEAHLMVLQGLDEEGLHTRAVAVRPGAPVEGKTLAEMRLRADHGLTVLAIRRDGRTLANPDGSFRVQPGDRLVLIGSADQFVACADLFRETSPPAGA